MESRPDPHASHLRDWILITALFLIFFWIPAIFVIAELGRPQYLFLQKFPVYEFHPAKVEVLEVLGKPLTLYWHEDNRHANVYCGVYAQDESGFRAATYSEFVILENHLRPH